MSSTLYDVIREEYGAVLNQEIAFNVALAITVRISEIVIRPDILLQSMSIAMAYLWHIFSYEKKQYSAVYHGLIR